MTRSKLGLLGLCAMVLGLMAFGTAAAQAEEGASWLILPKEGSVKTGAELNASLNLETDTPTLVLHSEILKIKVLFLCTGVKAVNAKLQKEGTIAKEYIEVEKKLTPVGSQVLFSGCTTELNGSETPEPKCEPNDPIDGPGFIVTNAGHALLVLGASGQKLIKILPDAAGEDPEFAKIVTGSKCAIGTSVPVIGKLFLKDCKEKGEEHLVKHLVETEATETKLFTISLTTEHAATLLGSTWAFLTGVGTHEGLAFGGMWK